jgi:hypothetical protein
MLGVPGAVKIGLLLTYPAIALSLVTAYFCGRSWRRRQWALASRIHYTAVTVALLGFIWFCSTWNLIGWRF